MSVNTRDITILSQEYHRNGIGGRGFHATTLLWPETGYMTEFVAITPEPDEETVLALASQREGREVSGEEYESAAYRLARRDLLIEDTMVVRPEGLRPSKIGRGHDKWRGSDHVGPTVVDYLLKAEEETK